MRCTVDESHVRITRKEVHTLNAYLVFHNDLEESVDEMYVMPLVLFFADSGISPKQ